LNDDITSPAVNIFQLARFNFMYTPPLEAGTTLWGFQRGRAPPLVKGGVKTPPAKWLRLLCETFKLKTTTFFA